MFDVGAQAGTAAAGSNTATSGLRSLGGLFGGGSSTTATATVGIRGLSAEDIANAQPNPAAVDDCLQRFGVARERAVFVGDSSIDVATARNAGIAVWALPYGYNMGQPIEASQPDRVIQDISALLSI